jgi:addiction module RelE/StbE family toxin
MKIYYTSEFFRRYKRLPEIIRSLAKEKIKLFSEDPFDVGLKTHKLHGRFKNYWAFSVDYNCRIIFKFEHGEVVKFYSIGGHSIYK